jgi:cell division protein FtsB
VADLRRTVVDRDAHLIRMQEHNEALERQIADLSQKLADTSLRALVKRTTRGKLG